MYPPAGCQEGPRKMRGAPPPHAEIDYKIYGDDMQFVEVELDPNEATVAEAGGMMFMDDGIEMETIFGDGSQQQSGFMGALMGAGKRLLTGESLFMTVFYNRSSRNARSRLARPIRARSSPSTWRRSAASSSPRRIRFWRRPRRQHRHRVSTETWRRLVRRRRVHHAAAAGRRLGVRSRRGHAAGTDARARRAHPRRHGCIVALQPSVNYEIEYVGEIKSALFGGEGLFFATLRGPGKSGCSRCRSAGWQTALSAPSRA